MPDNIRIANLGDTMKIKLWAAIALLLLCAPACAEIVPVTFLHLNDIYEITPVAGGQQGGMARLATLRKQLLKANPRTYTILAGDCFSPSALGTAVVDGEKLAGRHMVAVMNAVGFDFATFGNHEFDVKPEQFLRRIGESKFKWFSGNVADAEGRPFPRVEPHVVFTAKGEHGGEVRIGLIGVTLESNKASWVRYDDPLATAVRQARELRGQVDILIAVTHQSLEADRKLVAAAPEIDLVLGGHEHDNVQQWRGLRFAPIFKADANARSAYVLDLAYDTDRRRLVKMEPHFREITNALPEDRETAELVQDWVKRGYAAFRADGFQPEKEVAKTPEALDGLEATVRNGSGNLTDLIAAAMLKAVPEAELAVFNGGMVRIDDVVPPGPITQYDVLRMIPFGGQVLRVDMRGDLLSKVLNQGRANRGEGGYLQTAGVAGHEGAWTVGGASLDPERVYKVAILDFLMKGLEQGLGFLNEKADGVEAVAPATDIRFAVIEKMREHWAAPGSTAKANTD
jgi:5'-nucleotidase/UDP-sugar diphosphatase